MAKKAISTIVKELHDANLRYVAAISKANDIKDYIAELELELERRGVVPGVYKYRKGLILNVERKTRVGKASVSWKKVGEDTDKIIREVTSIFIKKNNECRKQYKNFERMLVRHIKKSIESHSKQGTDKTTTVYNTFKVEK